MQSRRLNRFVVPRCLVLVAALGLVSAASASAAVKDRIVGPVQASTRVALGHTVSPRAALALDLGEAPAGQIIDGMMLRFNLTDAQQAALTQLLADQQNPASAQFHKWLTPEQYAAQFGLSSGDLAKIASWLTGQGFTITETARSGTFITFGGTAAQVKQAFGTSVHQLSLNGEAHRANLTEPTLPAGIAAAVGHLAGLDDFRPKARLRHGQMPSTGVQAHNTVTTSAGTSHFLAPGDFYTIYDTQPLLTNGATGSGVTIAVMGQVDITPTDVANFRTASGLSAQAPTIKTYGTDPGNPVCTHTPLPAACNDQAESLLDVEWAGAVAPAANILFVTSNDAFTSLSDAINDRVAPIITISYGNCEVGIADGLRTSLNQAFQQANAQGITIFAPTGDYGATDCDSGTSATRGLTVDFPASSPYVTAVGGTMFNEGTGSYWNATNGANGGSVLSYIPEVVWNEDTAGSSFSAGGGGASAYFAKPPWQTGSGVPNDFSRDVPDISLNAAASHDGYLFCAFGSCASGAYYPANGGNFNYAGGTSFAAPAFAGLIALVEQQQGGAGLGNINPKIYALANSTFYNNIFHDIQTGNNNSPCTAGTPNCPSGGTIGYSAGPGYDLASGWGTVDAAVLASKWSPIASPVSGSQAISITTVKGTQTTVSGGSAVALTVTVASGTTGVAGTPTGSVQFLLDGVAIASSTVALSGGTATFTISTTGLTSGQHVITAVYSGDATYNTAKGTLSLVDFSLTPATATITVPSGGTSMGIPFTVTPLEGFTGVIAFTSSGNINANYTVSPASVTIGSTTTSAMTLYAIQAAVSSLRTGAPLQQARADTPGILPPGARTRWYAAGSGTMLAGLVLLCVPRRRRLGSLLALLLSVGALGAVGCGSSSSTVSGTKITNTPAGTYTVVLNAAGTSTGGVLVSHNATITVVVQ